MKLMTQEILNRIPALYAQAGKGEDAIVHVKFFDPCSHWTWYATEFDPEDGIFFGWVDGDFPELGYFSLEELESSKNSLGISIERDIHFTPKTMREVQQG